MKTIREATIGRATIRLVQVKSGYSGIILVAGSVKARIDGADSEEVWERLHAEVGKSNPNFFGFEGARLRFLRIFPGGFQSSAYKDYERDYKLSAKARLDAQAPVDRALTETGFGEAVLSVFRATNLLSLFEKTRLQEVLRGRNADAFVRGAAKFTVGDTKRGLSEMQQALKPHEAAKWTVATYLPFLWKPQLHMFLKPEVTKEFAARVGHRFAQDYRPQLDYPVYQSLLELVAATRSAIVELGPVDLIDVQSFIWVVGEYSVESEAGLESQA